MAEVIPAILEKKAFIITTWTALSITAPAAPASAGIYRLSLRKTTRSFFFDQQRRALAAELSLKLARVGLSVNEEHYTSALATASYCIAVPGPKRVCNRGAGAGQRATMPG